MLRSFGFAIFFVVTVIATHRATTDHNWVSAAVGCFIFTLVILFGGVAAEIVELRKTIERLIQKESEIRRPNPNEMGMVTGNKV